MCNKPMQHAAVLIGNMPVGPKCAQRAGLIEKARKGHGALRLAGPRLPRTKAQATPETLDLFEQEGSDV